MSINNLSLKNIPLVTVAIPVFRGAQYIRSAIDSVLSQSFGDYELLVVDNDSDDGTVDIVRSYSDPRIVLVCNENNIGAEGNWNKCLMLARGHYIKILPHDDTLERDCLKDQVEVLVADQMEQISLVFCGRKIINNEGKVLARRRIRGMLTGVISARNLIRLCVRKGTNLIGEPGAVLFRSSVARVSGNFDGKISYVIDLDYWVRLLDHGDAYYIDEALSSFRVTNGSWSAEIGKRQSKDYICFIDLIFRGRADYISNFDISLGRLTATVNGVLRRIFFRLLS
jgi:glycosyltransferase involved in cell wall biosynthesis